PAFAPAVGMAQDAFVLGQFVGMLRAAVPGEVGRRTKGHHAQRAQAAPCPDRAQSASSARPGPN
ncbi:hypothetical protein KC219_21010, partial [Mycobacterium tuberculosis]|nr:hypothetical protein [Mycobacterium tuberculosis]